MVVQAVAYKGPMSIGIGDQPEPMGSGLLIEVEACGICGTDLTIFRGSHPRARAPLVPGHEFVGRLLEAGVSMPAGTRVVCNPLISCGACDACRDGRSHVCSSLRLIGIDLDGGLAERVRVPEDMLVQIDEALPAVVAAQAEPLAVCIHAARRGRVEPGARVAIIGAGPIGATLAFWLRHCGIEDITLFDVNAARISQMRSYDLKAYFAEDAAAMHGASFDVVFECAGAGAAVSNALELAATSARIVIVSIHKVPQPVDLQRLSFSELEIIGARVYDPSDFALAVDRLPHLQNDLLRIAGETWPLEQAPLAFQQLSAGSGPLKVICSSVANIAAPIFRDVAPQHGCHRLQTCAAPDGIGPR